MGTEQDLRKLLYSVLTVFVVAITLGVVTNWRQYVAQERTQSVVCGLVKESAATEAGKLNAYAADPPITAAGQAQRDATQAALDRYLLLADRIGCKI